MKSEIILIPLDSRPVNSLLPAEISAIAGRKVVRPPIRILGDLNHPADTLSVAAWLKDASKKFPEAPIVASSDMLAYGGLIWSRKDFVTLNQAKKNIKVHKTAGLYSKTRKTYIFSTIPRDAATVHAGSDFDEWRRQMKGSSISPSAARNRNIQILGGLLDSAACGDIDYLMIGKEDTAENNPYVNEIKTIEKRISRSLKGRAGIAAGADELASLLCARAISDDSSKKTSISIYYSGISPRFIPMYEPFPIEKTIKAQIGCAGARIATTEKAESHLLIHGSDVKEDVFLRQLSPKLSKTTKDANASKTSKIISDFLRDNKRVGLADVRYMNGASEALVSNLISKALFFQLGAYAGWNTSANSTGTVIAHLVALSRAADDGVATEKRIETLYQRLLEDYSYSCIVREKIVSGLDDPTGKQKPNVRKQVSKMMREEAENLTKHLADCSPDGEAAAAARMELKKASLPWGRIFELMTNCAASKIKR